MALIFYEIREDQTVFLFHQRACPLQPLSSGVPSFAPDLPFPALRRSSLATVDPFFLSSSASSISSPRSGEVGFCFFCSLSLGILGRAFRTGLPVRPLLSYSGLDAGSGSLLNLSSPLGVFDNRFDMFPFIQSSLILSRSSRRTSTSFSFRHLLSQI